jgi:type IV pilus assembly protein PilE
MSPRRGNAGVTLIELMMVMVVVAILAAIAVPSYRGYVIRASRADAKAATLSMAGALERCFTRFNAYDDAGCALAITNVPSGDGHYLLGASVTPSTFLVTAVPQGAQAADTGCGNFRLNQANQRTVSGAKGAAECWGR